MKAILVVDIPDDLKYEELYCNGEIRYTSEFNTGSVFLQEIYRGLLKPMPEKELIWNDNDDYQMGWNACIDEILGEEE